MIFAAIVALTLAIILIVISAIALLAWMGAIADEVDRHR
jgi:hypothetical protein